jgi:hypothetical protein
VFTTDFNRYAMVDDTIECTIAQWTFVAVIRRDDSSGPPDQEHDGFWPSLDPRDDGYIGPKSKSTLRRRMARARQIMTDWERDKWFWCGIELCAYHVSDEDSEDDLLRNVNRNTSTWCIECNYPTFRKRDRPNAYLRTVANDLLREALASLMHPLQLAVYESRQAQGL